MSVRWAGGIGAGLFVGLFFSSTVVLFLNFRVCGYASFVYCETSYDTPEVRYRPFVNSFTYDSNVQC